MLILGLSKLAGEHVIALFFIQSNLHNILILVFCSLLEIISLFKVEEESQQMFAEAL